MKKSIVFLLLVAFLLIGCAPAEPVAQDMPAESVAEEVAAPEAEAAPEATPVPPTEVPAEEEAVAETEEPAEEAAAMPVTAETPRPPEELKDGFFISMTTDNIDRAAMAVGLATKIRKQTGRPVTIFFNTQGVRLVDVDIPQNVHKSGNTIHEMIQMFMDEGGVALVCPVCMVNVGGMETVDILPGVLIGSPEFTWSALFAENVTSLSY